MGIMRTYQWWMLLIIICTYIICIVQHNDIYHHHIIYRPLSFISHHLYPIFYHFSPSPISSSLSCSITPPQSPFNCHHYSSCWSHSSSHYFFGRCLEWAAIPDVPASHSGMLIRNESPVASAQCTGATAINSCNCFLMVQLLVMIYWH